MTRTLSLLLISSLLLLGFTTTPAGAAPPAAPRVAVFDDAGFVDTASATPNAESDNVQAALASFGFTVSTFTGTSEAAWRAATTGVQALVVPELENGDLALALDENAEQALVDYVSSGGALIVQGRGDRAAALINAAFNFAVSPAVGDISTLSDTFTIGTRFMAGPPTLPAPSETSALAALAGMYLTPAVTVSVGRIPVGAGRVIYLGWDWFDAAPLGGLDGGWNEVLRRAVLEGRTPQRRVAVYADAAFTDMTSPAPGAEARNVQASLIQADMLVTRVTSTTDGAFATLGTRRPAVEAFVVPELTADLAAAMTETGRSSVRDFVGTGGTLVVLGGAPANANPTAFLNQVFGFTTTALSPGAPGSLRGPDATGTLYGGSRATLSHFGANSCIGGLPPGSRSVYVSGGATSVAVIPFGEGSIHFLGWSWQNATPIGVQDGGWIDVLERAVRHTPPARRVAMFANEAFVDAIESPAQATVSAEGVALAASLYARGHAVKTFVETDRAGWSRALADADVLAIPDLENGATLHTTLDAATRADVARFVRNGGLLVMAVNGFGRAASFVNAVFGLSVAEGALGGISSLTTSAFGTPFQSGPPSLASVNAVVSVSGAGVTPLYQSAGGGTTVGWISVGAGHVLLLGWDYFDAAPAGGAQDGGWVDVLDLGVQSARPRVRNVALFADSSYVNTTSPTATLGAVSLPASLELFDHRVREFSGTSHASFREALAGADTLVIPKQHVASLAPALSSSARGALRDFVAAGGELIVNGDPGTRAADLVNALFGWHVVQQPASGPLAGGVLAGTRFGGGPVSLSGTPASSELLLSSLPLGSLSAYADAGGDATSVAELPYGRGRVLYLGWTYVAPPAPGAANPAWLDVLDRAVQETRLRTRRIALFSDGGYVDALPQAELRNTDQSLERLGQARSPFSGVSDSDWGIALAKQQVLFVPELEVASLSSALAPASQVPQLVRDFVARGGTLVAAQDASGNTNALLNRVFGWSLIWENGTIGAKYPRNGAAAGTEFATGPAELPHLNATRRIGGLPSGALALYGGLLAPVFAVIPYGAGEVVISGWDVFGFAPYDSADFGQAAWREVLRRALELAPPDARHVAVFHNAAFSGGPPLDGPRFVEAALLQQEHAVVPFSGTNLASFMEALSRADTVIIPERDAAPIVQALDEATREQIRRFVQGGGGLVAMDGSIFDVTNELFGLDANGLFQSSPPGASPQPDALGTNFAGGPAPLRGVAPSDPIAGFQFAPTGARTLYAAETESWIPVAALPQGAGSASLLGFHYENAAPLGIYDDGWLETLDRAVREGPGNDADRDGIAASSELCPLTSDALQTDVDADGVADACDSCVAIANPRVTGSAFSFLELNEWASLTGGQRDDDHDGFGNRCDAKFPFTTGTLVGAPDLVELRASLGRSRTLDTCGAGHVLPCAIYDLDESATLIGAGDVSSLRTRLGKLPGPTCTNCPLPCNAGPSGTCEELPHP